MSKHQDQRRALLLVIPSLTSPHHTNHTTCAKEHYSCLLQTHQSYRYSKKQQLGPKLKLLPRIPSLTSLHHTTCAKEHYLNPAQTHQGVLEPMSKHQDQRRALLLVIPSLSHLHRRSIEFHQYHLVPKNVLDHCRTETSMLPRPKSELSPANVQIHEQQQ